MNKRLQDMEDAIQIINDTIKKSDLDVSLEVATDGNGAYRIYNSNDNIENIITSEDPSKSCLMISEEQVDSFLANQDNIATLINNGIISNNEIRWDKINDSVFVILHLVDKSDEEGEPGEENISDDGLGDDITDIDNEKFDDLDLAEESYVLTVCDNEFLITDAHKNVYGVGKYNDKLVETMKKALCPMKTIILSNYGNIDKVKSQANEAKNDLIDFVNDFGGKMIFKNNVVSCWGNTVSVQEATVEDIAKYPSAANYSLLEHWTIADRQLAAKARIKIQKESFHKTKAIMNLKKSCDVISAKTDMKHVVAETNNFSVVLPLDTVQHVCPISYVSKNGRCAAYPCEDILKEQNEAINNKTYNAIKIARMLENWFKSVNDEPNQLAANMIKQTIHLAENNKKYSDMVVIGCYNNLYDYMLENFDQKKFAKMKIIMEAYKKVAASKLIQNENAALFSLISSKHLEYMQVTESKDFMRKYSNDQYDEIFNLKNVKNENLHMAASSIIMLILETVGYVSTLSQEEVKCIQEIVVENTLTQNKLKNCAFILSSLISECKDKRVIEAMEDGLMACHMLSLKCIEREA